MATDLEKLVVSLEASITKYERTMARAVQVSNQQAKKVEQRWEKVSVVLNNAGQKAFTGISRHALIAAASFLSVGAALAQTSAALKTMGDINDKSGAAGLDPEFFQGVALEAKKAGVELDGFAEATATFNKLSSQAVEGRGKLVAQLKGEHAELLASIQAADTQRERFELVADAIRDAKTQSEAVVIATAAFGGNGIKLVDVLRGGREELEKIVQKAKDAGAIFDSDLVKHADELGDKLDESKQIIDVQLKEAFVNLGPVILNITGLIGEWLRLLNITLDQFKAIEDRVAINPLQNRLVELENRLAVLGPGIASMKSGGGTGGIAGAAMVKEYNDALAESLRLQERIAQLQGKPKNNLAPPSWRPRNAPDLPAATHGFGGDSSSTGGKHDAGGSRNGTSLGLNPQQITAVATSIGQVGAAAGKTATDLDTASKASTELSDTMKSVESAAEGLAGSLIDDFVDGQLSIDSIVDAAKDLEKQLLKMAANQLIQGLFSSLAGGGIGGGGNIGGGIASAAGLLFGGGRAGGGPVTPGHVYKVNENTPNSEYFAPSMAGTIVPRLPSMAGLRSGRPLTIRQEPVRVLVDMDPKGQWRTHVDTRALGAAHAVGAQVLKNVPGRMQSYQKDGE